MTDSSATKLGSEQGTAGAMRWRDYLREHPIDCGHFTNEPIEVMRPEWESPMVICIDQMRPELNVAGMLWRPVPAPAATPDSKPTPSERG